MALKGMAQANLDLSVLLEGNIKGGFYIRGLARLHHGRVAVFYQVYPQILMEVIHQFGRNVTIFHLDTRER